MSEVGKMDVAMQGYWFRLLHQIYPRRRFDIEPMQYSKRDTPQQHNYVL